MKNRLEDEEEIQSEKDVEVEEDVCIISNIYLEERCF